MLVHVGRDQRYSWGAVRTAEHLWAPSPNLCPNRAVAQKFVKAKIRLARRKKKIYTEIKELKRCLPALLTALLAIVFDDLQQAVELDWFGDVGIGGE